MWTPNIATAPQQIRRLPFCGVGSRDTDAFTIILPTPGSAHAGTGGVYLSKALGQVVTRLPISAIYVQQISPPVRNLAKVLDRIKISLFLNTSQLAQVLGVTRPSVYGWLNGAEPRNTASEEILRIAGLVEEIQALGITDKSPLRTAYENQPSIIACLLAREDVTQAVVRLRAAQSNGSREPIRLKRFGHKAYTAEDISSVVSGV